MPPFSDEIYCRSPQELQRVGKAHKAEQPYVRQGHAMTAEVHRKVLLDYSEWKTLGKINQRDYNKFLVKLQQVPTRF